MQRFGEEINDPPPGPASTGVLPMIPAVAASIRGRTNSLVIIELGIKKGPEGPLVFIVLDHDNASSHHYEKMLHILCVDQSLAESS